MPIWQVEIFKRRKKNDTISNVTQLKSLTQLSIYCKKTSIALLEHLLSGIGREQVLYLVASLMR